jgi:hypothetical protein
MIPADIDAELVRIASLPPLERAAAAEALEEELRVALDQIAPDTRPA